MEKLKLPPPEIVNMLRNVSRRIANDWHMPDMADDLFQEALLDQSRGRSRSVRLIWIDMLRSMFGSKRRSTEAFMKARFSGTRSYALIDNEVKQIANPDEQEKRDREEFVSAALSAVRKKYWVKNQSDLRPMILTLSLKYGLNHEEIAEILNITPSYVCMLSKQLIRVVKKGLVERI